MNIKKITGIIILLATLFCDTSFAMTPSTWAVNEFDSARLYGLITEDVYFSDYSGKISRMAFCGLVIRLYDKLSDSNPRSTGKNPFKDVNDNNVTRAYHLGIVKGVSDTEFAPYSNIKREEMARMFYNLLNAMNITVSTDAAVLSFINDISDISGWARESVAAMLNGGYMQGMGDNLFSPASAVTVEQAVVLSGRFFLRHEDNPVKMPSPVIASHNDKQFVSYTDLNVSWDYPSNEAASKTEYTLYLITSSGKTRDVRWSQTTTEKNYSIPANVIASYDECYIAVEAGGIYSKSVFICLGEEKVHIIGKRDIEATIENGILSFSWVGVGDASDYVVEIQEMRIRTDPPVPPAAPVLEARTWGSTDYSMRIYHPRHYVVTVYPVNEALEKYIHLSDSFEIWTAPNYYSGDLTSIQNITTKEEADAHMKTITINVWKLGSNGVKTPSDAKLTVNAELADVFAKIFEEIFNGPEQFPIKSVGGYSWRAPMSSGSLSEHNYGTAVDINPDENYCLYSNGTVVGKHWLPYEDPYSITPYGDVMRAFEENGFTWGGDAWSSTFDYMHFSYMGR